MKAFEEQYRFRRRMALIVVIFILMIVLYYSNKIELSSFFYQNDNDMIYKDFQFNLLSFSAILAGFMFTALSLLLSVNDNKLINEMKKLKLWDTIHKTLIAGIYISLCSIFIAALIIFITLGDTLARTLSFFQLNFIILSIVLFLFAVIDVEFIITTVRKNAKKGNMTDEQIKEFRNRTGN